MSTLQRKFQYNLERFQQTTFFSGDKLSISIFSKQDYIAKKFHSCVFFFAKNVYQS